ncbi:MAG TPA: M15 family metallopeptidase [Actinospica sp.]|jgi:D-alanyl-D-alanine dipeptidase|nr:M15 family metallopeptidase [Actinospica sp.]
MTPSNADIDDIADIVLISDPRIRGVSVRDSGEGLVDLRGTLLVDGRRGDADGWFAHVREGVGDRLVAADRGLARGHGVRLLIVEAYRPPGVQVSIFEGYRAELLAAAPGLSGEEADALASRYVAPLAVAPHVGGAAVDLTLVDGDGRELDMGCPEAATPEESGGACYTDAPGLSAAARGNRAMLGEALASVGMVNYPTEWWHWSYGDRYWAYVSGAEFAIYDAATPPPCAASESLV